MEKEKEKEKDKDKDKDKEKDKDKDKKKEKTPRRGKIDEEIAKLNALGMAQQYMTTDGDVYAPLSARRHSDAEDYLVPAKIKESLKIEEIKHPNEKNPMTKSVKSKKEDEKSNGEKKREDSSKENWILLIF